MRRARLLSVVVLVAACNRGGLADLPPLDRDLAVPIDLAAPPPDLTAAIDLTDPPRPPDLRAADLLPPPTDLATGCPGPLLVAKLPSLMLPGFSGNAPIAAADFDGDGHQDVLRVGASSPSLWLSFGAGDGTLGSAISIADRGVELAVGDLDGDGQPDVVTSVEVGASLILNRGHRSFAAPVTYRTLGGSGVQALTIGDLDEDGHADLLLGDHDNLELFPGNGDGTLGAGALVGDMRDFGPFTLADLDADGHLDVVGAIAQGATVRFGDGTGRFPRRLDVVDPGLVAGPPLSADLDGDRLLDLVLPDQTHGFLSVVLNLGHGRFSAPTRFPFDGKGQLRRVVAVDLDGRNGLDLVPVISNGGAFQVLLSQGGGQFGPALRQANLGDCVGPQGLAVADFNEDHQPDLACALYGYQVNRVPILLGACH